MELGDHKRMKRGNLPLGSLPDSFQRGASFFYVQCDDVFIIRNVSAAPICNKFSVGPRDKGSRPILGLTIESVRDLLLELFHSTPKIYKHSMTRPCLARSSVSHNQGNGQIGPKRN